MCASPRVHRLSNRLANQIAAGEVVERPASVLKELLENSLDSGATSIRVDIEGGGVRLIRVQDNGCGIHKEDMALALSRHATSKIGKLADLEKLSSMGFRGEALASITSVSRCRVVSKTVEARTGYAVEVAGSELQGEPVPQAHPSGTTVEVRDLFFNTPVRRRFLRSERTEQGHLEDVFKRMALSRFGIRFSLHVGQRNIYRLPASQDVGGQEHRVMRLCGKAFLSHALFIEFEAAGMCLRGWVATPDFARSQTDLQYFFLNGRAIRDRLVNHAIRQAYQDRLYHGRHPAYLLFLEMAPQQVDVNVHPTKHEVRFREARLVHDFLLDTLQRVLDGRAESVPEPSAGSGKSSALPRWGKRPAAPESPAIDRVNEQMAVYKKLHGPPQSALTDARGGLSGSALAALYDRYVLVRQKEKLLLIDSVRAREYLIKERLTISLNKGAISAQPLLLPVRVELEAGRRYRNVERLGKQLYRFGIDISLAGPKQILVRQLPETIRNCKPDTFITTLLSEIEQTGGKENEQRMIEMIARHAARTIALPAALDELNAFLREIEPLAEYRQGGAGVSVELDQPALARLFVNRG